MCATCGCGQDEVQVTSMSGAASPGDGTGLLRHDDTHLRRQEGFHTQAVDHPMLVRRNIAEIRGIIGANA